MFALSFWAGRIFLSKKDRIAKRILKHKYSFSLAFVAVCVILEINGTSLYMWAEYLNGGKAYSPVWGIPRAVRSDEWVVWSTFAFAQDFEGYPAISTALSR